MTKPSNPRQVALSFLDQKTLPTDLAIQGWYPNLVAISGYSVASIDRFGKEDFLQKSRIDFRDENSAAIDNDTLLNIASVTKVMTGAAILRMIENMNEADRNQYFPQGLQTKFSHFYELIEERYSALNLDYVKNRMRGENPEISLENLLTHTSGIPDIDWTKVDDAGRSLFYSEEKPADGKFAELDYMTKANRHEIGTYIYSDTGFELIGMLMSAVATKQRGEIVTCQEIIRENVIKRIGMDDTYTPDQMSFDHNLNRVVVTAAPQKNIASGYPRLGSDVIKARSFLGCIACGAVYSTPKDICKFLKAVFSDKIRADGGFFETQESIDLHNSAQVEQTDQKGNVIRNEIGKNYYGIGYKFAISDNGEKIKYHTSGAPGSHGWSGYKNGEVVCCLVTTQCVTVPFASAILDFKKEQRSALGQSSYSDDEEQKQLYELNQYLIRNHSKELLFDRFTSAFHAYNVQDETKKIARELYPNLSVTKPEMTPVTEQNSQQSTL